MSCFWCCSSLLLPSSMDDWSAVLLLDWKLVLPATKTLLLAFLPCIEGEEDDGFAIAKSFDDGKPFFCDDDDA